MTSPAEAPAGRAPSCCLPAAVVHDLTDELPGSMRVYDAARTVTDLMRLRHRFGEPVAHAALNRYLAQPGSRPAPLLSYARSLGAFGPVRTALRRPR